MTPWSPLKLATPCECMLRAALALTVTPPDDDATFTVVSPTMLTVPPSISTLPELAVSRTSPCAEFTATPASPSICTLPTSAPLAAGIHVFPLLRSTPMQLCCVPPTATRMLLLSLHTPVAPSVSSFTLPIALFRVSPISPSISTVPALSSFRVPPAVAEMEPLAFHW